MERPKSLRVCFVAFCLTLSPAIVTSAGVSPGDVIDSANWEKAQGFLPESVTNWVKKGDFVVQIHDLDYDLSQFFPPYALKAHSTNTGKYVLAQDGEIKDVRTGEPANPIVGLPFPEIDDDDPEAARKIMINNRYLRLIPGHVRLPFVAKFVGRSGFEREFLCDWQQFAMDGHPGAKAIENPDRFELYSLVLLEKPYDVAGTATLLWRYLDPLKQDMTFAYMSMIRRARRMSPANRSDSMFGSDICLDDGLGYDGKITAFEWKLLRKQDVVIPLLDTRPILVVRNEHGEWHTTKDIKPVIYGYQREGWTGAPWAPTNLAWVKRTAYVLEMKSKDRYYNYGTQYMWVDEETYGCTFKMIYDRSGKFWKTFFLVGAFCQSADKKMALLGGADAVMIDERSQHATILENASPGNRMTFLANIDVNDFSLSGFQKYCK